MDTLVINSIPVPAEIGGISRSTLLTGLEQTDLNPVPACVPADPGRSVWFPSFRPEFAVSCISVPVSGMPFAVIAGYVRACLACAPVVLGAKVGHASSSSIYRNYPYARW
jgi:hypothetical protein